MRDAKVNARSTGMTLLLDHRHEPWAAEALSNLARLGWKPPLHRGVLVDVPTPRDTPQRTPRDTPRDTPQVVLETKELTPPTRARASEYVVRRGGKRPRKAQQESLAGVDLIAPEIRLEYQTLRELAAKSWRVLGVQIWTAPEPTDEMLMTYAGWRKTRSFEDAIRMLRIRLNKRVKTGQVWNGPLQQLFEVKLTNGEKPFDWFSWLVSVESNSQDREVREIFEDYAARHRETRPSRAVAGGDEGTPAAVRNGPLPFIRPEVGSPERH